MSEYLIQSGTLGAIADAIRAKKGTSNAMTPAQMATEISGITTVQTLSWHQCPEAVRNYLAAALAAYPTNGGATIIDQYAPNYINIPEDVSRANSKPIGFTVDGVTFHDNEPLVAEPFSTQNKAGTLTALDWLRWINTTLAAPATGSDYKRGYNCRDLGGWPCDGGVIRYGMLVRGSEPNPDDKELMVDKIGIMTEVQLLPLNEQADDYKMRSAWGIEWAGNDTEDTKVYSPSDISDPAKKALWAKILKAIIGSVNEAKAVYFHCGVGADRTGVTAMVLEGILGVSSDNVDIDFELTNFALGWRLINGSVYRGRSYPTHVDLKRSFYSIPLVGGLSDTFRNHCVSFALSLGITIDEINAFRAAMIDGTPETITVNLSSYSVSKTAENVSYSNTATSVSQFQGYETDITPAAGYRIESVTVTMGGVDITNSVFSGELAPPNGTVYITANGETDVSAFETAHVSVPTGITPSGTKQITSTALTDVAAYANAQVVDANLVAANIKKDMTILGVTGTYEGSGGGGGSSVNCKIFNYTSAAAVANQEVTVVSGDADIAAHYADPNAMVVVRKVTDNTTRGSAIILGTNHSFGASNSMYMNYNGSTNAAAVSSVPLTAATGSGVSVRCNANGDIIVHCGSTANNFGGADYIIVFTW